MSTTSACNSVTKRHREPCCRLAEAEATSGADQVYRRSLNFTLAGFSLGRRRQPGSPQQGRTPSAHAVGLARLTDPCEWGGGIDGGHTGTLGDRICQTVCQSALLAGQSTLIQYPRPINGGGSGIRTHGTLSRTHAFQACALSRSAIPPLGAH